MKAINCLLFVFLIVCVSCTKSGKMQVKNNLSGAVLENVAWGDISISTKLLPGETSTKREIYEDSKNSIKFPAEFQLKFYLQVNGDLVYLQTRKKYKIDDDDDLTIIVDDTTKVYN